MAQSTHTPSFNTRPANTVAYLPLPEVNKKQGCKRVSHASTCSSLVPQPRPFVLPRSPLPLSLCACCLTDDLLVSLQFIDGEVLSELEQSYFLLFQARLQAQPRSSRVVSARRLLAQLCDRTPARIHATNTRAAHGGGESEGAAEDKEGQGREEWSWTKGRVERREAAAQQQRR